MKDIRLMMDRFLNLMFGDKFSKFDSRIRGEISDDLAWFLSQRYNGVDRTFSLLLDEEIMRLAEYAIESGEFVAFFDKLIGNGTNVVWASFLVVALHHLRSVRLYMVRSRSARKVVQHFHSLRKFSGAIGYDDGERFIRVLVCRRSE